jgi:hypothetical protein
MIDPFPLQRIHMHVVEFFASFLQTPDIKIVEASLPEAAEHVVVRKWQTKLPGSDALAATQSARNALLQHLNHSGRRACGRLTDEQMNVLWHDNIAYERESVAVARFAQNLNKSISIGNGAQKGQSSVARECNEMEIASSVMTNELVSHEQKVKILTLQKAGGPATRKGKGFGKYKSQYLVDDVSEWYYSTENKCQMKKGEKMRHPPKHDKLRRTESRGNP